MFINTIIINYVCDNNKLNTVLYYDYFGFVEFSVCNCCRDGLSFTQFSVGNTVIVRPSVPLKTLFFDCCCFHSIRSCLFSMTFPSVLSRFALCLDVLVFCSNGLLLILGLCHSKVLIHLQEFWAINEWRLFTLRKISFTSFFLKMQTRRRLKPVEISKRLVTRKHLILITLSFEPYHLKCRVTYCCKLCFFKIWPSLWWPEMARVLKQNTVKDFLTD